MYKRTILICDDNARDAEALRRALVAENYNVIISRSGRAAQTVLGEHEVDLMVLESRLPDIDGLEFCRSLRTQSSLPLIFLSSCAEEVDRILGLKMGADDYVAKPFSPREMAARVEAVLRRARSGREGEIRISIGGMTMLPESYSAFVGEEKLELIPSDFKLLSYMAANPGKVLSREKLLDAVWGFEYYGSQRSVDTQIKRIRAALKDKPVQFAIKSIYGVGYKLEVLRES